MVFQWGINEIMIRAAAGGIYTLGLFIDVLNSPLIPTINIVSIKKSDHHVG